MFLPCPFCDKFEFRYASMNRLDCVVCNKCNAQGPFIDCTGLSDIDKRKRCQQAWNTRKGKEFK